MGNRKLPFGYRMELGEVAVHEKESGLVSRMFQAYLEGATYTGLAAALRKQPVAYDVGKQWNKNMVDRVLKERRYTGCSGFPPIIPSDLLERALEKREEARPPARSTEVQRMLRRMTGVRMSIWSSGSTDF